MIKIENWSSYQSYRDRRPPWIRFHKTMLDNYEYQSMSAESRALLPMLWLLASEDEDPVSGLIRDSYEKVTFRLRMDKKVFEKSLKELEKNSFISLIVGCQAIDNKQCNESVTVPYLDRNETVTPETETETEAETEEGDKSPPLDEAIFHYNQAAEKAGLPKAQKITKTRKSKLKARLADCGGLEGWLVALEKVSNSSFCKGKNDRGWTADLDFMLKEQSFVNIMEGKYDDKKSATKTNRAKEAITKGAAQFSRMQ